MKTWQEVHEAELDSNLFCTMELNRIKARRRAESEQKRKDRIINTISYILFFLFALAFEFVLLMKL